ncbi:MAG: insulinase family protein [Chitinophagaceae bacterium]|nr:insulinase family protein [Chitinophagaceae bacterium]
MKNIYIAAIGILMMFNSSAQIKIDRTKPPKAGPAPVLAIGEPVTYKLANGITVLVVENHKLPKVSASYFIDYGPVAEGKKAGVMDIMGRMLNEGTTSMTKAAFDEAVDQMGAMVNLSASGGNASALTRYFDKAFMLMADGILKPAFKSESFEKLKTQEITGLKADEKNAKAISARVVSALNFGVDHPAGEFETEQTIQALTLDDVKEMYAQYITPSRGFLTFVGDIKPLQAKALAEKAFGNWKGSSISLMKLDDVKNPATTEVNLVDVPNAVQSEISVTNLVRLPMNHPDYFPALLANNILGGHPDARLFMNLREKHGFTYGAYSNIGSGRFQTMFRASAAVRNEKTDSAVMEFFNEINNIRLKKVSEEELKNAKALYAGNFALTLEDPAVVASFARNIIINDLPKDFYKTYLQKINAVTAEAVQRVAQKYFNYNNARIVVVGKSEAVKPGLSKLGYAIELFDKYAKPVTADTASTQTPVNVSAKEIIEKYIKAIGGAEELKKINSVLTNGEMSLQGMKLAVVDKKMNPNLVLMEMQMNGSTVMKQLYDGKTGYQEQMGNKKMIPEDELSQYKNVKGIFPQLFYNDGSYKLEVKGMEKIADKDAYKVNITSNTGDKSTEYYDVNTGYLVKEEKSVKAEGQDIQQTFEYSNFKKAGNVFFPFTNSITIQSPAGNQELVMEIKEVKLNEGVKAEEFK